MKIISYNVNGIRAAINKGFIDWLHETNVDVICIQEIKANKEQVDLEFDQYPYQYWNSAIKKGYSGTAIFSKIKPINEIYGIGIEEHDQEGRVISLEFEKYFLVYQLFLMPLVIAQHKEVFVMNVLKLHNYQQVNWER